MEWSEKKGRYSVILIDNQISIRTNQQGFHCSTLKVNKLKDRNQFSILWIEFANLSINFISQVFKKQYNN